MAVGPLANMPNLFRRSTLENHDAFSTIIHDLRYQPHARCSGWVTSTLRDYTVTYSYDVILTQKSQRKEQNEQQISGRDEMVVNIHGHGHKPSVRQSGWRTSAVPNYLVTYCWDCKRSEKWEDPKDADRDGIAVTDLEGEESDFNSLDLATELQEFNAKGMRTTGNPKSMSKSQGHGSEKAIVSHAVPKPEPVVSDEDVEDHHSDSTNWDRESRGAWSMKTRDTQSPDSGSAETIRDCKRRRIEVDSTVPLQPRSCKVRLGNRISIGRPAKCFCED